MSSSDSEPDQQQLLQSLYANGQEFLSSFDLPHTNKRKESPSSSKRAQKKRKMVVEADDADEEEEWNGFSGNTVNGKDEDVVSEDEEEEEEGSLDEDDFDYGEEENIQISGSSRKPAVVVFSESLTSTQTSSAKLSRTQMKAFMSSKVAKVTSEVKSEDEEGENEDSGDEQSNIQNDALLHRLVHTKILSGSLNPELDLTPAQRRKALAGRVLEVSGKVKLGKGETAVRAAERNKAAKHVREGLVAKQKERSEKALEEAKNMGNYHPALKQLYDTSSSSKTNKKRERGLRMGVGSFSGGILKLGKNELSAINGPQSRLRKKGGKRGGRR
ncbi:hypothetical protein C8Q75DRAFT_893105 [Abortiporus biennis]|nr:hypothetical protein C8Q75DRAFT_893105 [Abortiporus biennis]